MVWIRMRKMIWWEGIRIGGLKKEKRQKKDKPKKDKKAAPERDTIKLCGVPPPRDGYESILPNLVGGVLGDLGPPVKLIRLWEVVHSHWLIRLKE
jgi:hypothetical protein